MSGWADGIASGSGRGIAALRLALAFAAGAGLIAALPPLSLWPLAPLAFCALFVLLPRHRPGAAALTGWAFGLGNFAIGISWIAESFFVEADRFAALAVPAVGGLAAGLALFPALAALVHGRLRRWAAFRPAIADAVLFAACWAAAEWLRGHLLTGFPWNLAAYGLADAPATLRQPAAWVGSYGLSFVVVLVGALPGAAMLARGPARLAAAGLCAGLAAGLAVAGSWRLATPEPAPPGTLLRVVQGNIPQAEKWAPGSRERTLAKYLDLSTRPGDFDLLLWPETAFPGFLDEDADARARISAALPEGALIMTGAPDRIETATDETYFNTVQVYDHTGTLLTGYAKHHLVPFGEYVPLQGWLPIGRFTEGLGDFSPGPGPRTLALPGIPLVALAVCYEIIFPGGAVDRLFRPDWIFNATNDAWFGTSIGPEQHLTSARFRAVEEGLPVVRAANTGISAVIDARGHVLERRELQTDAVIDAPLPPALPPTLYARVGDRAFLALLVAALAAVGLTGRRR